MSHAPESVSLAECTLETFSPLVGASFQMGDDSGAPLSLQLEDAQALSDEPPALPEGTTRRPFALTFLGPLDPPVAQGTYCLLNDAMGALEIFVVPISRDPDGMRYEAVFA